MERTLVLVKPDGVRRGLAGGIMARFEQRGLRVSALKMYRVSREAAETHYAEHAGKPFFSGLVDSLVSGPLIAMILEGPRAIRAVRVMMGATDPLDAPPGSIRGDLALGMPQNVVHGSDGPESAEREIRIFFRADEINE